jgi:hypothetical protein
MLLREVAQAATVDENGEVWWQASDAEAAVNALANAGLVILGLDLRDYDDSGAFVEIAWSDYRPTGTNDVEAAPLAALQALARRRRVRSTPRCGVCCGFFGICERLRLPCQG